jgi:syntaxin 16
MAQLQQMNANATEREREIIAIAQSINELAALFNELSVLVIEQGTVLDRIDYNVEQTLFKVREGVEELQVAEDHSKKAYTMKLIFFLIFIIIILTCILIFKHVKFSGN